MLDSNPSDSVDQLVPQMIQDIFLRDHLRADDVLVVSVGGNDVALRPSLSTIAAMASLTFWSSVASIRSVRRGTGRTRLSAADASSHRPLPLPRSGWACGSGHFRRMYKRDGAGYLRALMSRCAPRQGAAGSGGPPPVPACVALCTIYYPDQASAA